jgi:hypothetical protein
MNKQEQKISLTLSQLQSLLAEQKMLVATNLLSMTYYYNTESTDGTSYSINNIDKEKFKEVAHKTENPKDFETLKRYL